MKKKAMTAREKVRADLLNLAETAPREDLAGLLVLFSEVQHRILDRLVKVRALEKPFKLDGKVRKKS